jgi:hypothetical protein
MYITAVAMIRDPGNACDLLMTTVHNHMTRNNIKKMILTSAKCTQVRYKKKVMIRRFSWMLTSISGTNKVERRDVYYMLY